MEAKKSHASAFKIVHIVGAMLWTGGIACMLAALISAAQQSNAEAVVSQLAIIETFDYYVVIPGVTLCIALGFIYGIFTPWGFISHRWVLLKWVLFLTACIPAALFFLPLLDGMEDLVVLEGMKALDMEAFRTNHLILVTMTLVQLILSAFMIGISVYKPFKKKRGAVQRERREAHGRIGEGTRQASAKVASSGAEEH